MLHKSLRHLEAIKMRILIFSFSLLFLAQPTFHAALLAEPGEAKLTPQELSDGIRNSWNWLESLSNFQPYLPATMPSQKQWGDLCLLTARKCKLRGERFFEGERVAVAQARAGNTEGLLATFSEFGVKPEHQAQHLAQLAFAIKSEPRQAEELRKEPALFRTYSLSLADEYEDAGQFDKAIEVLSRLPADKDGYLLILLHARAGQFDQAMKILSLVREQKEWNPYNLERNLALQLVKAGKDEEAKKMLASYLANVRELKTLDERLREAFWSADVLNQIGDDMQRRLFLTDCQKWGDEETAREPDVRSKASSASYLAQIATNAGDREFAKIAVNRAVKLLKESSKKDDWVLAHYASLQASLEMVEESKHTAKEAITIARKAADEDKRDSNLCSVVEHLAFFRNEALLDEIDATVGEIRTLTWRAIAVRGLVEFEVRHKQWQRAKRHMAEEHNYLSRKEIDRTEAFVHKFELDLLAARMHAEQGDKAAAQKLLQELFRRGYSPSAGDFTEKVCAEQRNLGFLQDAWSTAIWIPELDERFRCLWLVMDSAREAKRARQR